MMRCKYVGALMTAAMFALTGPATAAEQTSPLDLVPKDAAGFVHIRVGDIWKHDAFAPVRDYVTRTEPILLKEFEGTFGFLPSDVETLTLIYPSFDKRSLSPPIIVVRTAKPYDKAKVLTAMRAVSRAQIDAAEYPSNTFRSVGSKAYPSSTPLPPKGVAFPAPPPKIPAPPLPPEKRDFEPQCGPNDIEDPEYFHDSSARVVIKPDLRARQFVLGRGEGHLFCLDEQTMVFLPQGRFEAESSIVPYVVQLLRRQEKGLLDPALAEAAKRTAVIAIDAGAVARTRPQKLGSEDERLLRPLTSATLAMLSVDLGKELSATLTFHAANLADARKIEDALHGAIGSIKKGIPDWRKEAKRSTLPELTTLLVDQIELAVNNAAVKQSDTTVTATTSLRPDDAFLAALKAGVAQVRVARERTISQNNLKQIGLALHGYHDAHGRLPFPGVGKFGAPLGQGNNNPNLSWRVAILPFIEQGNLYQQFKHDEPWDSEHNKKLIERMPKVFAPLNGVKAEKGHTYYQIFSGREALKAGLSIVNITDGTSNTLMVVESGDAVPWTRPEDMLYDSKKPLPKLGALFNGDFNALMMDGSVRFIRKSIDEKILRAFITPSGGEVADAPEK